MPSIKFPQKFLRRGSQVRRDIDELLNRLHQASPVGLHLGCGSKPIPGMINCDLHFQGADRILDAVDLGEFPDGSVDLVEHHHLMEHLSFAEAAKGVREWARVLKPGGYLVITCPDLTRIIRKWIFAKGPRRWGKIIQMIYGSQDRAGMFHKSGYDRERMAALLKPQGLQIEFSYSPYPSRSTPSLLIIARKR